MSTNRLADKYTVPAPRYTSYPTVPYWENDAFSAAAWKESVVNSFSAMDSTEGISVYIHLPFCESLCTYCGCNTRITRNHVVEEPYMQTLWKEWDMYLALLPARPLIRELHLGGGTPTFFSPDNLAKLVKGILDRADVHPAAEFSFEAHPGNTTSGHLEQLHALGFKRLSFGIQDFDPLVQLTINRVQSYEEVEQATNDARAAGYTSVNYDLIYGLPMQTMAGLTATIAAVLKLRPDRIAFYSYAHVPWVKPGQRSYTEKDLPEGEFKHQLYETGRALLKAGGYLEIGMDHFTLPTDSLFEAEARGTLHRNFMGYTEQYSRLMIGLGVSAISDSWAGFAQNVKKVEEYTALINSGELPVFKGHLLNAEDLIVRQHILNIMCKGETSWTSYTEFVVLAEGMARMCELEADGLVVLDGNSVRVTIAGKRFLRNICMALDLRLWRKVPATQLFSTSG